MGVFFDVSGICRAILHIICQLLGEYLEGPGVEHLGFLLTFDKLQENPLSCEKPRNLCPQLTQLFCRPSVLTQGVKFSAAKLNDIREASCSKGGTLPSVV